MEQRPSSRRRVIIPAGTLNSDQINVIEVPRELLQNVNVPLLVTPARRGLQAQPISNLDNLPMETSIYRSEREKLANTTRNQDTSSNSRPSSVRKTARNDLNVESAGEAYDELDFTGDALLRNYNPQRPYTMIRNLQAVPTPRSPTSLTRSQMREYQRLEVKSQEGVDARRMRRVLANMSSQKKPNRSTTFTDDFADFEPDQIPRHSPPCEPLRSNLRNTHDEILIDEPYQLADAFPGNEPGDVEEDDGPYAEANYAYANSYQPASRSSYYAHQNQEEYARPRSPSNALRSSNANKTPTYEAAFPPGKSPPSDFTYERYENYEQPSSNNYSEGVYDFSAPRNWDNLPVYEAQDVSWDQPDTLYDWPENVIN